MEFNFDWLVSLVLTGVTAFGIVRTGLHYMKGDLKGSKRELKAIIIVCFTIGIIPGLPSICTNLGKSVVSPINTIVNTVSNNIETDVVKSVEGK